MTAITIEVPAEMSEELWELFNKEKEVLSRLGITEEDIDAIEVEIE